MIDGKRKFVAKKSQCRITLQIIYEPSFFYCGELDRTSFNFPQTTAFRTFPQNTSFNIFFKSIYVTSHLFYKSVDCRSMKLICCQHLTARKTIVSKLLIYFIVSFV